MILEFTVGNFRSIDEPVTLTMQAQGIKEGMNPYLATHARKNYSLTAAIYGANSSGKSNIVRAISTMKSCVFNSVLLNDGDRLHYEPFMLKEGSVGLPTLFEIVFVNDGSQYRYGFEYTQRSIENEWLFKGSGKQAKALFVRNSEGVGFDDQAFGEGNVKVESINSNRLFLSLCAQLGGRTSKAVMSWFRTELNVVSGINNTSYRALSKQQLLSQTEESRQALDFFKKIQLGFVNLTARKEENEEWVANEADSLLPQAGEQALNNSIVVESTHQVYDQNGQVCGHQIFKFDKQESDGTQKLFDLSGPIFNTLQHGAVLFVDELDAKMHPLISQQIIMLFNSPQHNPHKAQLIFTTHDTHLLSAHLLRRDQIWFTEKDRQERTDLYNMMDIRFEDGTKPRNDSNYEKNYIAGRYGAIPYIINE